MLRRLFLHMLMDEATAFGAVSTSTNDPVKLWGRAMDVCDERRIMRQESAFSFVQCHSPSINAVTVLDVRLYGG